MPTRGSRISNMNREAQESPRIFSRKWFARSSGLLDGPAALLARHDVPPNTITLAALMVGIFAGGLFALDLRPWAVSAVVLCGLLDVLDGKVALKADKSTRFGAILDSTLDRYSEFFIYLGLAVHFRNRWPVWIVFFTLLGATMVSYTRAKAESLGIPCRMGVMQRGERIIVITMGALIGSICGAYDTAMIVSLSLIAVMANITAVQRTFHVRRTEEQIKSHREANANE